MKPKFEFTTEIWFFEVYNLCNGKIHVKQKMMQLHLSSPIETYLNMSEHVCTCLRSSMTCPNFP